MTQGRRAKLFKRRLNDTFKNFDRIDDNEFDEIMVISQAERVMMVMFLEERELHGEYQEYRKIIMDHAKQQTKTSS